MSESDDILERLKHPERESERHRPNQRLFYRNIINGTFILLAAIAMIGLGVSWTGATSPTWCYALALLAVFVKMIDVVLRIPDMLKRPKASQMSARERFSALGAEEGKKESQDSSDGQKTSLNENSKKTSL